MTLLAKLVALSVWLPAAIGPSPPEGHGDHQLPRPRQINVFDCATGTTAVPVDEAQRAAVLDLMKRVCAGQR